jgi:hypothetical protein
MSGAARKVSVSMPEDLTSAVQRRVGRGKFSQYVTEAVTRQFELDLLADLFLKRIWQRPALRRRTTNNRGRDAGPRQ